MTIMINPFDAGGYSLAEMTTAAEALGWEYLGIADHSKASFQANGLDEARLLRQVAEIRALNASRRFSTRVFAGVECDILGDGRLDLDDAALAALDYVVASVHGGFAQDEATMTARAAWLPASVVTVNLSPLFAIALAVSLRFSTPSSEISIIRFDA